MSSRSLKYSFSLLHVDHVQLSKRWNYKSVISPYYRLYYIDEGEGLLSNAGDKLKLEAGYIYIIPSYTLCNLYCPEYLSQYFIQFFEESPDGMSLFHHNRALMKVSATEMDIAHFKRLLDINPGRGINRSDNPKVYEKNAYYREYQELNNRQTMAVYLETQGILLQLVARFLESRQFEAMASRVIPQKVLDAMSYIQLNLHQPLTIAHLAQRANQHADYFSRQFLQFTGERPLAYIHSKRIERAQYLISTTDLPYVSIASETGFDNLPHFSKVFKKITSLTPGQFRKQSQQGHIAH
ncbi:AraC family transcriptional regulator [Paraflavitalea sp. CAU 1676]|uniref:helix-turn-helix domain-containing protein n=1 Tax=Paraflavitalea sp. CAU 1676 TaxID=3032598 RepID=UPI0023DCE4E2|nr:AraC family transcriptional regulator [Paraflavitalea sp. CAU 1676]MDF2193498.1 AraC family transcriptional regulator [Paraflavitalea sp. CAU 1676]